MTDAPTATATDEPTPTITEQPAIAVVATDAPTVTPSATPTASLPAIVEVTEPGVATATRVPVELIIGGVALVLVFAYIVLYLRGQSAIDRYAAGFVMETCPICERGKLSVETRTERTIGIPSGRHIVRCSNCRSILRHTSTRRWRYAVDKLANEAMYKAYNGQILTERQLVNLREVTVKPRHARRNDSQPTFDDTEDV